MIKPGLRVLEYNAADRYVKGTDPQEKIQYSYHFGSLGGHESQLFECHRLRVKVMAKKESEGPGLRWKAPHLDGHKQLAGKVEKMSCILLVNAFRG